MSSRGSTGAPKSRAPAHRNSFAFAHNKNSAKTKKIASTPIRGVCVRCEEKIEWRKKFRKYKPLTQPKKCQLCQQKAIKDAYHVICLSCAGKLRECAKCRTKEDEQGRVDDSQDQALLLQAEATFRERERRTLARLLEKDEQAAMDYVRAKLTGASRTEADGDAGAADDDDEDDDDSDDGDSDLEEGDDK